ncbi:MAG: D-alanyl-D-alanine carboxypeptidase/D-alanyl-D-alanine-endopeptidase, partial [Candidatus Dadabacteria bacterium]
MAKKKKLLSWSFTVFFCFIFFKSANVFSENRKISQFLNSFKHKVGVSVFDLSSGKELFSFKSRELLTPASVQKLFTAYLAFKTLGVDYQFITNFWGKWDKGKKLHLFIETSSDPSLTTEDLWVIARKIARWGPKEITSVTVVSRSANCRKAPLGQRAYQSAVAFLPFNFNAFSVDICPTRLKKKAIISVDPKECGIQAKGEVITAKSDHFFVDKISKDLVKVRGRIKAERKEACASVYRSLESPELCFLKTLMSFLEDLGVKTKKNIPFRKSFQLTKEGLTLLYRHKSKPLSLIVWSMNHYSSNPIAEQLLRTVLEKRGFSCMFTKDGAEKIKKAFLREKFFYSFKDFFFFVDGSGLSRKNKVAPFLAALLLNNVYKDFTLSSEFLASLAKPFSVGTLKERKYIAPFIIRAKTGSLTGVSSLAGYLKTKRGKIVSFAIIQNGLTSKKVAEKVEAKLIQYFYRS